MKIKTLTNIISKTSLILYFVSLTAPANTEFFLMTMIDTGPRPVYGIQLLLEGWEGLFIGNPAWLANITYFFAFVFVQKNNPLALIISVITLALGLSTYLLCSGIYGDKGPNMAACFSTFSIGFYIWILSFVLLCVSALIIRKNQASK